MSSKIVAKLALPLPLDSVEAVVARLESEHGPGLALRQSHGAFLVLNGPMPEFECWCGRCAGVVIDGLNGVGIWAPHVMYLCPDCGNKRCPRATWHRYECTGSNEPGQTGTIANGGEG